MAIDVQFHPVPVLNVDDSRLSWFYTLSDGAQRELKVLIKNKVFEYLQGGLSKHSAALPMPGQVLLLTGPVKWKHKRQNYSLVVLAYSKIENINRALHLVTHIAITDWRSGLVTELREGMKEMGYTMRYDLSSLFISASETPLAELMMTAVDGLERSNFDEIHFGQGDPGGDSKAN